jgi:hypothetical protein
MYKKIILILILTVTLISGCTDEYDISVINKSSYPIDFDFTTGHRLNEKIHLDPGKEWHYPILESLGHSMGTFTPPPGTYVDYKYSDNTYVFYTAHRLTFNANSGTLKKDKKALPVLTVIENEEIQLPDGGETWERWNDSEKRYYRSGGWATTAAGTGTAIVYLLGQSYSFNSNITLYVKWE